MRTVCVKDVYYEKRTEHVISMGTKQNWNVNSGDTCLLFGFKRL